MLLTGTAYVAAVFCGGVCVGRIAHAGVGAPAGRAGSSATLAKHLALYTQWRHRARLPGQLMFALLPGIQARRGGAQRSGTEAAISTNDDDFSDGM